MYNSREKSDDSSVPGNIYSEETTLTFKEMGLYHMGANTFLIAVSGGFSMILTSLFIQFLGSSAPTWSYILPLVVEAMLVLLIMPLFSKVKIMGKKIEKGDQD